VRYLSGREVPAAVELGLWPTLPAGSARLRTVVSGSTDASTGMAALLPFVDGDGLSAAT
jgi:hypothetical protein